MAQAEVRPKSYGPRVKTTPPLTGWTEIRWDVPRELADELSDVLSLATDGSVLVEPTGAGVTLVAAFEAAADSPAKRKEIRAELARFAKSQPAFTRLADHDWKNAWREVWKPFRVGPFAIVPKDFTGTLRATDQRIFLEPGVAFGTGRHATTRACLLALSTLDVTGARVLDAGFGSGLLGVAAAVRGAASVEGFDTDRHALPVAQELAHDNGVAACCEFRVGGFEEVDHVTEPYDLVFANIYADVIVTEAARLERLLAPSGTLVVSGCAREHRDRVLSSLCSDKLGDRALSLETEYGQRWHTFVLGRGTFSMY